MQRWLSSRGQHDDIVAYRERRELRQDLMALVASARDDLRTIYAAADSDEEKRHLKKARLEQLARVASTRLEQSGRESASWLRGELNNARLVSMNLYEGRLPAFRALLKSCDEDIRCFYAQAGELAQLDKSARDAALVALAGG